MRRDDYYYYNIPWQPKVCFPTKIWWEQKHHIAILLLFVGPYL